MGGGVCYVAVQTGDIPDRLDGRRGADCSRRFSGKTRAGAAPRMMCSDGHEFKCGTNTGNSLQSHRGRVTSISLRGSRHLFQECLDQPLTAFFAGGLLDAGAGFVGGAGAADGFDCNRGFACAAFDDAD